MAEKDGEFSFEVDGVTHAVNVLKLKLGEGKALEKATGLPFGTLLDGLKVLSLDSLAAFAWAAMKRTDPTTTYEQVLDAVDIDSLITGMQDAADGDDDAAPGEGDVSAEPADPTND